MARLSRILLPSVVAAFAPAAFCSPCYAIQYLSLEEARQLCFSAHASFEPVPVSFSSVQLEEIETRTKERRETGTPKIWKVIEQGKLSGYLIADAVIGKHLAIDYVVALDPTRSVRQIEILEYRENFGGQIRNRQWLDQFKGKRTQDPLKFNENIKNISGATLSSRHITEAVTRNLVELEIALR